MKLHHLSKAGEPFSITPKRIWAEDFSVLVVGPRRFRRVPDTRPSRKPTVLN